MVKKMIFQGTRMEERLDDAINVLRNHAEPLSQTGGLGQLPPNLGPSQVGALGYTVSPPESPFPESIKVERATHNSSKLNFSRSPFIRPIGVKLLVFAIFRKF